MITLTAVIIPKLPQDASVVGVKSDLGKALIASNSGSIVKINNAV
ncbi:MULTISPECIES: hypothetical protein [Pseudoalteromonas]|uniref:Uncharacterized protein n=1 Tax=Pseudoalteromonas haloplanktis TaxID=228 RepID=A0ABU1BES1_PSEHA|nr:MULTISPECIES: hypothetical protein [Pseudoalteromonas]MDQ9092747.1 hypothetical protein [Pseudoalteromonas haloplanktis]